MTNSQSNRQLMIITGHSQGLGAALLEQAYKDYDIIGLSRTPAVEQFKTRDKDKDPLTEFQIDLSDTTQVAALIQSDAWIQKIRQYKHIILINNAGTIAPTGVLEHVKADQKQDERNEQVIKAIALNVTSPVLLSEALITKRSSNAASVKIVHISSGAGRSTYAGWSIYGPCKAFLDHHAKTLHHENIPNVKVESIAPGVIDTNMQQDIRELTADNFPNVKRFQELNQNHELQTAQHTAQRLIEHIQSQTFGANPLTDLRLI